VSEHGRVDELRLLAGPDRVFTTSGAREAGYRASDLRRLTRSGAITSLAEGWYAVGSPQSFEELHRLRTSVAEARYAGSAVASHYSELLRLGLPLFRADLSTVHLTRVRPATARRRQGILIHPVAPTALTSEGRVPPAHAIVQTGVVCSPMAALIAADAALNRRLVTPQQLSGAAEAVRGRPGTALVGPFLALADGRAQSPGETRLRHAFHLMALPVTPQARITDGRRTAYADFLLDEYPVVVEFDGLVKYGAGGMRPGQAELVAEKEREDWIRGLGYQVVRVVSADLDDLMTLAERFAAAIRRSRQGRFGSAAG
jgi:hypothetical protein